MNIVSWAYKRPQPSDCLVYSMMSLNSLSTVGRSFKSPSFAACFLRVLESLGLVPLLNLRSKRAYRYHYNVLPSSTPHDTRDPGLRFRTPPYRQWWKEGCVGLKNEDPYHNFNFPVIANGAVRIALGTVNFMGTCSSNPSEEWALSTRDV